MLKDYSELHYNTFMNLMNAFNKSGEIALLDKAAKMSRAGMQAMRDKARFQGFKAVVTRRKTVKKKK